jgi:hypothetical protein
MNDGTMARQVQPSLGFSVPSAAPGEPPPVKEVARGGGGGGGVAPAAGDLPVHPAALSYPMWTDQKLADLVDDIKANGLDNPIMLGDWEEDGNKIKDGIVDGRNRYRACKLAGVEPIFDRLDGQDPERYIRSQNAKRRDLTPSQRAIVAAEAWIRAKKQGLIQSKGARTDLPSRKVRAGLIKDPERYFAKEYSVGEKLIKMALTLLRFDPPAVEDVRNGIERLQSAHEKAAKRHGSSVNAEIRLTKLWRERADLAAEVESGDRDLDAAEAQAKKEADEHKQLRWAFTSNVIDAVRGFDHPIDTVSECAALFDPVLCENRGEELSHDRLIAAAEFATALADELFPQEEEDGTAA